MPAGVMPYGVPASISASQTGTRALGVDPDLVAEVAGVAGARDRDRDVADGRVYEAEVLERREIRRRQLLEDRARQRALQRERAGALGDVLDRDVEPDGVHRQPAEVRLGAREAERVLVEPADGAVVDDLAVRVAPRRVEHLADAALA